MKLRSKLLVSFLLVSLLLIVGLFFLLHWSFERGASTYMRQIDQQQLADLAEELAAYYADRGSWQEFEQQPASWWAWLRSQRYDEQRKQVRRVPVGPDIDKPGVDKPEPTVLDRSQDSVVHRSRRRKPFFLLDSQQRLLAGRYREGGALQAIELPLAGDSKIVGYVGLPPPPSRLRAFRKAPLFTRQYTVLVYCALGALVISGLAAIPLSARLSRRILQLHDQVTELSKGKFERRVAVAGNDEIAELAQHLNHLAQTLNDAQHQRQQLTADISHELRTPVAALQANIEAMQDGVLEMSPQALDSLHEQVMRLSQLINDLYQLSLEDSGSLYYQLEYCELQLLLQQLVSGYQSQFQRAQITLQLQPENSEPVAVKADAQRLQQLFINLLENSLRYTRSPGKVQVLLSSDDQQVSVTVKDSAPGVDKRLHHKLTDRLFRVDESRSRASGGAGIGLNLCAAIVRVHGGTLTFADSELGGLSVTVNLPRYREHQ